MDIAVGALAVCPIGHMSPIAGLVILSTQSGHFGVWFTCAGRQLELPTVPCVLLPSMSGSTSAHTGCMLLPSVQQGTASS